MIPNSPSTHKRFKIKSLQKKLQFLGLKRLDKDTEIPLLHLKQRDKELKTFTSPIEMDILIEWQSKNNLNLLFRNSLKNQLLGYFKTLLYLKVNLPLMLGLLISLRFSHKLKRSVMIVQLKL